MHFSLDESIINKAFYKGYSRRLDYSVIVLLLTGFLYLQV